MDNRELDKRIAEIKNKIDSDDSQDNHYLVNNNDVRYLLSEYERLKLISKTQSDVYRKLELRHRDIVTENKRLKGL